MLNNVMIGRYYPVNSSIHRMNPLSKIICTFMFVILSFLSSNLILNILLLFLTFTIVLMSNVDLKVYLKTLNSLKWFILFIILINLLFKVSISLIIVFVIRIVILVLYSSALTLTTPPTELTYGLELFLLPLKIIGFPVSKMALMLTLAIRFIPNLLDETKKIIKAQSSRGARYDNFKNKLLGIKSLLIPMFVITIKKADNLAQIMEVRLFSVSETRSNYRMNKWHLFDSYMVLIHLVILISVIVRGGF